ncbi:NAD(P)-dependent dehydrogenase (short-subunit alcohol dehydrogenase family) [Pseudonocardia sediminis]|uniref:NAD(P)-dependent dehydrogenase (Short-subunit alcohol dehydrogenase family) n=1 Tax=Pseudonocardia sediminis TaxID=1397368 RepID=A0A4Q7UTF8_PSEST|nr:SDR family NAD(P)-dependent oxidoreductase [Pseudonocardia sediminis]RZT84986.1 NAD(P)-dependent dehydrogenase (short-subunit alcohol dehydrogenase family) [Pseudonocardia sediminis]
MTLDFTGQVVIVTGAGRGLGRRYALDLGAAGARVVVHARRSDAAGGVVTAIRAAGGEAVAAVADARDGEVLASVALREFGRLDALLCNAGITRDRSFARTTPEDWAEVLDVHLGGAYAACAAVWPHLTGQGSGAIVLTTSGAGLHGNFGQAGYAAAKAGVIGLAKSLAIEGERKGVRVNAVAPMALTDMTRDVFGDGPPSTLAPEAVSPVVLALAHPSCPLTGEVVETGGGWASLLRWERSAGVRFPAGELSPGSVAARWPDIARFDRTADHPRTTADSLAAACAAASSGGTP